jgi:hypothetical protein
VGVPQPGPQRLDADGTAHVAHHADVPGGASGYELSERGARASSGETRWCDPRPEHGGACARWGASCPVARPVRSRAERMRRLTVRAVCPVESTYQASSVHRTHWTCNVVVFMRPVLCAGRGYQGSRLFIFTGIAIFFLVLFTCFYFTIVVICRLCGSRRGRYQPGTQLSAWPAPRTRAEPATSAELAERPHMDENGNPVVLVVLPDDTVTMGVLCRDGASPVDSRAAAQELAKVAGVQLTPLGLGGARRAAGAHVEVHRAHVRPAPALEAARYASALARCGTQRNASVVLPMPGASRDEDRVCSTAASSAGASSSSDSTSSSSTSASNTSGRGDQSHCSGSEGSGPGEQCGNDARLAASASSAPSSQAPDYAR